MAPVKDAINNHYSNHCKQCQDHSLLEQILTVLLRKGSLLARHLGEKN